MMKKTPALQFALRRMAAGAAIAILAVTALAARADAQMVAAIVNGDPVTNYDIEQRIKLVQLGGSQKAPSRQVILEELIDERLKIQLLKRYNIESIDKDVDNAFTNMARRMRQSAKQFTEQLERSGVKAETLKSRMKADLVWSQIIRGRYQSSFQFNDKEILARMENRKPEEAAAIGYDYTLRPILFVVPRGSPPAAFEARHKEAEAFRSRFLTCEQGVPIARAMPYVAVRAPVVKGSADLPPALRAILEKTEMGRLTAPEVTQQGIEVYALCGKKQSENAPAKKETRDEMFTEQFESHSKRFLKELRGQAMIEYRSAETMLARLALTLGEPAGIGPDVTLAAWLRRAELDLPPFYVLADPQCLARRAKLLGLNVPIEIVTAATASAAFGRALPVVPLGIEATAEPGRPDATSAATAIASIDRAVADVIGVVASAVVTNPVAKSVLYKAGFADPGHTEYLARLSFAETGNPAWPVMMLWSPEVAVVPVTIHIPYKDVPQRLTRDLIFETGRVVAHDLIHRFGIAHPRLAVAGLNPHAGEDGTLGKEDSTIVKPAIERLQADGIDARGPLPGDTMFHEAARRTYDAALCMYHDQALIPIKTLAFDHAVNVTLGLPFVRTSPDHGTAFDIAGSGKADPSSLIAALKLAARLAEADRGRQRTPAAALI